ncbi:MAG: hypothetical protein J7M34_09980 [Anaerolineae bacterium]|nr:hypothetical protein [Anaerolineae bacterium]
MKKVIYKLLIIILVGLIVVGCKGKKKETPTPIPTPTSAVSEAKAAPTPTSATMKEKAAPTPTPEETPVTPTTAPTPESKPTESIEVSQSLKALQELNTYRSRLVADWAEVEAGKTITGNMEWLEEHVVKDHAYHATMKMRSSKEPEQHLMERIVIGQTQWLRFDNEAWISLGANQEAVPGLANIITPEDFLNSVENPKLVKSEEVINGVKTKHYIVTKEQLPNSNLLLPDGEKGLATASNVKIQDFQADFWIAEKGGYLVKFIVKDTMIQNPDSAQPKRIESTMTYEVYDVGAKIKIQPPTTASQPSSESEGKSSSTQPTPSGAGAIQIPSEAGGTISLPGFEKSGLPRPNGAAVMVSTPEMAIINAPQRVNEVATFYDQALSQAGWTKQETVTQSKDLILESYQRGNVQLGLTITWVGDEQRTQILLTIEQSK